ncbi:MAG: Nif3-like dinuclear metal center hexameric protein [Ruminococcaceae bacterium]|nr:Nif3-like dinuclear metal center hexameric protein [Oscillospiraceae bacterium]
MKVSDIYGIINQIAPYELALSFDNVGILLGNPEAKVNKAIVCLDCTPNAVKKAIKENAELIITHHPIIFEPLKSVVKSDGNVVYDCLVNGISVISMHTNLDVAIGGVNDQLAKALKLENIQTVTDDEGFSFRKGELKENMSADALAEYVKASLGGNVRYTDGGKNIKTVAVCGGSGGSELIFAMNSADAFVTADVKHKIFIEANAKGFTLLDAGHFHTENVIVNPLTELLNKQINGVQFITFNGNEIKTV